MLRGGAKLLLCSSLFGRAPLLDRAIHRRALFGRPSSFLSAALGRGTTLFLSSSFVFGAALRGRTLFGGPTLDRDALFIRAALGCGLLDSGAFRGRAFRGGGLLAGAELLLFAPLHGGLSLLDRALERRVFGCGPLLLFGATLLSDTSLLRGAIGRGTVLRRAPFVELARFGRRAPLLGRSFRRGAFFRGALFRRATIGRGTFGGRLLLRRAALFFDAPLFGDAPFFGGAQLHRLAFRFDASRLFGEPYLFRVPRERGVVDGGEGLFVLEDREGLVVFALRGRLLRDVGCGRDGLVHCRPRFLDARRCS